MLNSLLNLKTGLFRTSAIAFTLFISSCSTLPEAKNAACKEVRGAFDIGSGSTKAKVALIDRCLKVIESTLFDSSAPVPYSSDLAAQGETLSMSIQEEGLLIVAHLKSSAEKTPRVLEALKDGKQASVIWSGFATSAFRQAKNGRKVIAAFSEALDVGLVVISHEQEAELGYRSGTLAFPRSDQPLVVWDIGGGSQQIVYRSERTLIEGRASNAFKDHVIRKVLKKDPARVRTPNPIGVNRVSAALSAVKTFIPETIALPPGARVVGIGGVFQFGIPAMTGDSRSVTREALTLAIGEKAKMDDAALQDRYSATAVTNLILVRGMMEKLGVHSVTISPYQITDAYLLESAK